MLLAGVSSAALMLLSMQLSAETVKSVEFVSMAAPKAVGDMARFYSDAKVKVTYSDGTEELRPLATHLLYTALDRVGSNPYEAGRLYDAFGQGLLDPFGEPVVAETPDGTSLLRVPGQPSAPNGDPAAYHVVQWEYDWLLSDGSNARKAEGWYPRSPMTMNVNTLAQDRRTGRLRVVEQSNVDFSGVGGLWIPCAAGPTPWGTHLAGEEDYDLFNRGKTDASLAAMTELYFGNTKKANPYGYGYPVEVSVSPDGKSSVKKHYSMGRASWEIARVMADRKTVYYGDDGRYVGLFMYIADRAGDLGAGTLYAARWEQESDADGGSAKLTWIKLGHAADYEVAAMMEEETFSSTESTIFEFADGPTDGFTAIQAGTKKPEYVRLMPGKEKAAAFLETRRYAAYLGATTEFNKMEGVTFDPEKREVFIAMSRIEEAMLADDGGPNDHVKLPKISAGGVYALTTAAGVTDSDGNPIDSEWAATSMAGVPETIGVDLDTPDDLGNRAHPDHISGPDNLFFSPAMRTLFIGEDTGRHVNNFLWALNVDTRKLSRIASGPAGAELTGLSVVDDWNGFEYITTNYQHPGEGLSKLEMKDETLKAELISLIDNYAAAVGYIGGMPGMGDGERQMAGAQ